MALASSQSLLGYLGLEVCPPWLSHVLKSHSVREEKTFSWFKFQASCSKLCQDNIKSFDILIKIVPKNNYIIQINEANGPLQASKY